MAQEKMKIYCETSFWSWLVSRPSTNPDHAVKQAWTLKSDEESDPYVAEIRAVRARLNKTANYDVATLAKHTADAVRSIGIQYCGLKPLKPQFDLLAGSAG